MKKVYRFTLDKMERALVIRSIDESMLNINMKTLHAIYLKKKKDKHKLVFITPRLFMIMGTTTKTGDRLIHKYSIL